MKNEFVPYDIALAMKELGFDEECFGCFTKDKKLSLDYSTNKGEGHYFQDCAAPLYQQAFRWLQENSFNEDGESLVGDYLDTRWFRACFKKTNESQLLEALKFMLECKIMEKSM